MMPTITIDTDLCTKCGICVLICWPSVYVQETKDSIPEAINAGSCISCGHCVTICPKDAIVHSELPKGYAKPVISENMPSSEEVLELLRTRRSTRFFKDRPVERQMIERIIEAARFAPSYLNLQTTQFIVVEDKELLENIMQATSHYTTESVAKLHNPFIRRILSIRMQVPARVITEEVLPHFDYVVAEIRKGRDLVLYNAPILILFHAEKKPFSSVDINARLALQNATLMAYAQGLGSSYSSAIVQACERDKSVQQLVKLPENHKVYGALAIGYPKFEFKKRPERRKPNITWL
jgi:nitroreductase/Pyruvate/2-oxoacid:ferredoxin oxidoreductase delta subunit